MGALGGFELFKVNKYTSEYLLSHQVSLWSRTFLESCLLKGESAWENELLGTERIRKQRVNLFYLDLPPDYYLPVSAKGVFDDNVQRFFPMFAPDDPYLNLLKKSYQERVPHGARGPFSASPIRIISLRKRVVVRLNKLSRIFLRWLSRRRVNFKE